MASLIRCRRGRSTESRRSPERVCRETGRRLGLDRRQFFRSACGMAAAFVAMNEVYGEVFKVDPAEAKEPDAASPSIQPVQPVHFRRPDTLCPRRLPVRRPFGAGAIRRRQLVPGLEERAIGMTLERYKFENYVKEIFFDSDTKIALLSGAPFDDPTKWFLSNDQIKQGAENVNAVAGSRRLLFHSLFTPNQPGWMEEVDRVIEVVKPTSWKGYTIGDPLSPKTTKYPFRLDDEKVMYPFYEKAVRSGITNICIHKGLLPKDYETSIPAAPGSTPRWTMCRRRRKTGRRSISSCTTPPCSHSRRTPTTSSPSLNAPAISNGSPTSPRSRRKRRQQRVRRCRHQLCGLCHVQPAFLRRHDGGADQGPGTRPYLLGDRLGLVRLAAMADRSFRRLEIPEDMQKKHGFAPLGPPTAR